MNTDQNTPQNSPEKAILTRILNAQEAQLELLTALQERVGRLEQAFAIHGQILIKAKIAADGHQQAIEEIAGILRTIHPAAIH